MASDPEHPSREEALAAALEFFGLDEFQRIAAADLLRDLDGLPWPPAPGSEHERKLIDLGALVAPGLRLGELASAGAAPDRDVPDLCLVCGGESFDLTCERGEEAMVVCRRCGFRTKWLTP